MLKEDKLESVLDLLLGSGAENRVRPCVECHRLVEGDDEVNAAHYAEDHPNCSEGPSFSCELCLQVVAGPADNYHAHLKAHLQQPSDLARKKAAAKRYDPLDHLKAGQY